MKNVVKYIENKLSDLKNTLMDYINEKESFKDTYDFEELFEYTHDEKINIYGITFDAIRVLKQLDKSSYNTMMIDWVDELTSDNLYYLAKDYKFLCDEINDIYDEIDELQKKLLEIYFETKLEEEKDEEF